MRLTTALITCALLIARLAGAEEQVTSQSALDDRLINLPTHLTVGTMTFEVVFTHRFSQTIDDASFKDLFGLDSTADVGIGAALGLGPRVQVELYRSSYFKTWEPAVKWAVVRQGEAFPVSVALRTGADYRSADGVAERWSVFAQAVIAHRMGDRVDLFVIPTFASDTPTLENALNVGFGFSLHLRSWDVQVEAVPENRDARGGETAWAVGLNKRVRGHAFLLYLGNSRATTTGLLAGSDIPGGFKPGDVRLGFNLIRRFPE